MLSLKCILLRWLIKLHLHYQELNKFFSSIAPSHYIPLLKECLSGNLFEL